MPGPHGGGAVPPAAVAVTPSRRGRLVRAVCAGTAVAGVASLVLTGVLAGWGGGSWGLLLALGAALAAIELFPVQLTHRGESEALHLEEAFFVPLAFLLGPLPTMVVIGMAAALASAASKRRSVHKALFNVGMILFSTAAGLATASALGLTREALDARDVLAVLVGGLVFCAITATAVAGVISLAEGSRFRPVLLDGAVVRAATWVGSLSLGVLVLLAAEQRPVAVLAAAVPVVVLQFAFSGAMRQWQERRRTEALYEAAGRIHARVGVQGVRTELADAAAVLLVAGAAQVVDAGTPPHEGALRAEVDATLAVEVWDRGSGGAWTGGDATCLQALAVIAGGLLANARLYEQLHTVTSSLGEGVLACNPSGVVTFANPAADSMLGWAPGTLVGQQLAATVDPDRRQAVSVRGGEWVHLARLRCGATVRLDEYTVKRRDGSSLDVALTASPVQQEGTWWARSSRCAT